LTFYPSSAFMFSIDWWFTKGASSCPRWLCAVYERTLSKKIIFIAKFYHSQL